MELIMFKEINIQDMITFLSIVIGFLLWMIANIASYYFVEEWDIPYKLKFIDYKPFNCVKCLTFWANIFFNITLLVVTGFTYWIGNAVWFILTVLNGIAMHWIEKKNTLSLSEIEEIMKKYKNDDELD